MTDIRQIRVVIRGRVQGVWYRAWVTEEASELGLQGWVRNRRNGSVEAVFAGPSADVERMLKLCRRGPPLAQVSDVAVSDDGTPLQAGFTQLPTV